MKVNLLAYCPHMDNVILIESCVICSPAPEEWKNDVPPRGIARYVSPCPAGCGEPIRIGDYIVRLTQHVWVHLACKERYLHDRDADAAGGRTLPG